VTTPLLANSDRIRANCSIPSKIFPTHLCAEIRIDHEPNTQGIFITMSIKPFPDNSRHTNDGSSADAASGAFDSNTFSFDTYNPVPSFSAAAISQFSAAAPSQFSPAAAAQSTTAGGQAPTFQRFVQPGYSGKILQDGHSLRIGRRTAHARRYSDHDDNDHH
jgi:hypothetical protein